MISAGSSGSSHMTVSARMIRLRLVCCLAYTSGRLDRDEIVGRA